MGLREFFEERIKRVAGVDEVSDKVLTNLERETEYSARPLSQDMKSGGHLYSHLEFRTLEEIDREREEVQLLYKKYK